MAKHNIRTQGEGTSRRLAEQSAAKLALAAFQKISTGKSKS
ncbi:MAG: hypothetical protein VW548_02885 [Methylotenera sp.]